MPLNKPAFLMAGYICIRVDHEVTYKLNMTMAVCGCKGKV